MKMHAPFMHSKLQRFGEMLMVLLPVTYLDEVLLGVINCDDPDGFPTVLVGSRQSSLTVSQMDLATCHNIFGWLIFPCLAPASSSLLSRKKERLFANKEERKTSTSCS